MRAPPRVEGALDNSAAGAGSVSFRFINVCAYSRNHRPQKSSTRPVTHAHRKDTVIEGQQENA
jgi:hypothetical protein